MALTQPLALTIGSALSLPRITDDGMKGEYWTADRMVRETVSHAVTRGASGRTRSLVRVDKDVVAADPITAINKTLTGSVYTVFDFPLWGFSEADKIAIFAGLNTQLTASTNAILKQIIALEH
jgi:hypothetical protein